MVPTSLFTNAFINYHIMQFFFRFTNNNKGYVYVIEANTHFSPFFWLFPHNYTLYGPNHDECIIYEFGFVIEYADALGMTEEDVIVSKEIIRHQMNFAKTGY